MAFGRKHDPAVADADPAGGRARVVGLERAFAKIMITVGIIGIGTAVAAILGSQDVDSWITGVVVSTVSVILAALLWTRRRLA